MADEKVLYEVKDKIAWITLNRPESLNAVNRDMVKSIVGYCREAEEDPNVQVVIFKANGERAVLRRRRHQRSGAANAPAVEPEPESPLVQRQDEEHCDTRHAGAGDRGDEQDHHRAASWLHRGHGLIDEFSLRHPHCGRGRAAWPQRNAAWVYGRFRWYAADAASRRIPKALEICLSGELYDARNVYRIGLVNQLVPTIN